MKWLALLLSVFMIIVSCIPCADAAPEIDAHAQTIIKLNTNSQDHLPAADLCSPLCICNCCAGFALQTTTQKTSFSITEVIIQATIHRTVAVSKPSFSIWQPPKL